MSGHKSKLIRKVRNIWKIKMNGEIDIYMTPFQEERNHAHITRAIIIK